MFLNLNGTTAATSVLEAMITHSDNTATDIAMAAVGADRVRALIAEAGLENTEIADSTRKMFCYLAGLPAGQDAGWPKVKDLVEHPPNPRPALNDVMTMASTADDMVSWYRAVAAQRLLQDARHERRIRAHPGRWPRRCPRSCRPTSWRTARAAASTGRTSIACRLPGDMVVGATHVTFCFTINWTGPDNGVPDMMKRYVAAVAGVLEASAKDVG